MSSATSSKRNRSPEMRPASDSRLKRCCIEVSAQSRSCRSGSPTCRPFSTVPRAAVVRDHPAPPEIAVRSVGSVDPLDHKDDIVGHAVSVTLGGAILQILLLDLVFSVDSIITAVGMTDHLAIRYIAVIVAITVMLVAATPLANFIEKNPTIVMLALAFLLMIGTTLIAEGMGFHVPKGYIYAAMAFSALVEVLNMISRRARQSKGSSGH